MTWHGIRKKVWDRKSELLGILAWDSKAWDFAWDGWHGMAEWLNSHAMHGIVQSMGFAWDRHGIGMGLTWDVLGMVSRFPCV